MSHYSVVNNNNEISFRVDHDETSAIIFKYWRSTKVLTVDMKIDGTWTDAKEIARWS